MKNRDLWVLVPNCKGAMQCLDMEVVFMYQFLYPFFDAPNLVRLNRVFDYEFYSEPDHAVSTVPTK